MTLQLMKAFARDFSMTGGALIAVGVGVCTLLAPMSVMAENACAAAPALPPDLVAEAHKPHPFPPFCSIPPVPTDVRTAQDFKGAVQDVKLAQAELARATAPDTWSLTGSEDF